MEIESDLERWACLDDDCIGLFGRSLVDAERRPGLLSPGMLAFRERRDILQLLPSREMAR